MGGDNTQLLLKSNKTDPPRQQKDYEEEKKVIHELLQNTWTLKRVHFLSSLKVFHFFSIKKSQIINTTDPITIICIILAHFLSFVAFYLYKSPAMSEDILQCRPDNWKYRYIISTDVSDCPNLMFRSFGWVVCNFHYLSERETHFQSIDFFFWFIDLPYCIYTESISSSS